MLLSTQNAAFYLMERGWLPPAAVVDGDVTMVEASRRNKNLKVLRNEGPALFLKQAGQWDPQSMNTLRVEAVVYQLANSDTPFQALRPLLPAFHGFDPDRHVLVLAALPGAESLHVRQLRENAISPEVARALGAALGGVHRDVRKDRAAAAVPQGTFQAQPPWILSAAEFAGQPVQGVSGAGLQLFQVLQRYPEFPKLLAELRQGWRVETLVHGDIKWDNFLVATGEDGKHSVHLIDWELADWGDPSWDAGAVLQGFLTSWVISIQPGVGQGANPADFAQLPLAKLRPAVRAFWNAYVEALGVDRAEADRRLDRAVRYGAARMVQTAYELLQFSHEIAGPAVWLLQMSLNLLKDPRRGTVELFAL